MRLVPPQVERLNYINPHRGTIFGFIGSNQTIINGGHRIFQGYMRENKEIQFFQSCTAQVSECLTLIHWTLVHNHIGLSMVVHDPIRSDPDFIKNKILII